MDAERDFREADWIAAAKYLGSEMSPAEARAFEDWVATEPYRREALVALRRTWDNAAALPTAGTIDAMWRSLRERVKSSPAEVRPSADARDVSVRPRRSRVSLAFVPTPPRWLHPALIAAAVLLFASMAVLHQRRERRDVVVAPPDKQFRTAPGQRATIQLSDGSRVELGIASLLTVAPFTDSSRNVTLEGEGMFEVVHDERRPFRVRSAGAITEDLGTRFGVRSYPEDRNVRVFVTAGLVRVRGIASDSTSNLLRAGDLARVSPDGTITTEVNVDTTRYLAWTTSRVVLRNERLRDAVIELEQWHDVAIAIPDERVARMRITVDMRLGTLEETLRAVTIPLGLRYELSDRGAAILR